MTPEVIKFAANLGGIVFVFTLVIIACYRIVTLFGNKVGEYAKSFILAQQQQAKAMEGITSSVRMYTEKDNSEHREILLGIQVLAKEVRNLTSVIRRIEDGEAEHG